MDLGLKIGDIIQVEYTNDVMPYVTKPPVDHNFNNPGEPVPFPMNCPFCGAEVVINESGKSAICPNKKCPERVLQRMTNMMSKLNLKDFGESTFRELGTQSLTELLNYTYEDVKKLGPVTAEKLLERINAVKTTPIKDYELMGSIGFTGIAIETWKKILNAIPFNKLVAMDDTDLYCNLIAIRGIGEVTARTIVAERKDLADDISEIVNLPNIVISFGMKFGMIIRYTGCRPDDQLTAYLTSRGCDARGDAGVTKNTDILVVPYDGFTSSKVNKVGDQTIIVDMAAFKANPDKYIL